LRRAIRQRRGTREGYSNSEDSVAFEEGIGVKGGPSDRVDVHVVSACDEGDHPRQTSDGDMGGQSIVEARQAFSQ
jgi:hypothetical protein